MKVILTEEIRGLGTRGDIVNVKDGYARNYLLPKNLAREATAGNLKSIEQERKKWALLSQKEKEVAEKAAQSVKGVKVTITKRVGENNQLFGSVTANEIADALEAKGVEVDKRRIELAHPIKTLGTHEVDVEALPGEAVELAQQRGRLVAPSQDQDAAGPLLRRGVP